MAAGMDKTQSSPEPAEAAAGGENGAACGEDCACHGGGAGGKTKMVIGQIVIVIALVLVARAVLKKNKETTGLNGAKVFSAAQVPGGASGGAETANTSGGQQQAVVAALGAVEGKSVESADGNSPVVCGESIESLGDLNSRAADSDGVFVFLAGDDAGKARDAVRVIEKAAEKIRARGTKLGLFTLANGSAEFGDLAAQVPPPGVLAMVKGRGGSMVSDGITEDKLLQAFVTASSASTCGPSGCGPSGCP